MAQQAHAGAAMAGLPVPAPYQAKYTNLFKYARNPSLPSHNFKLDYD
jgi:hypothetical protein